MLAPNRIHCRGHVLKIILEPVNPLNFGGRTALASADPYYFGDTS
jgi:hypothetical protein